MSNVIALANVSGMSREEWLKMRRNGIGGSDISAIAGLNKYKSAMSVYLDKVGETKIEDTTGEAAYWGNVLEDVVAREFQSQTDFKVRRDNRMLAHPDHSFMIANLDRVLIGKKEILECKTSSAYRLKEWEEDEIPAEYILQVMHYLAVTGYEAAWIATLVGGQKFIYKRIERDEEMIQYIIGIASDFWNNHVLKRVPPAYDGSKASSDLLGRMFPTAEQGSEAELPDDAEKWIEQYKKTSEQLDELKVQKTEAENKLKALIGEAEIGIAQNHFVEWKTVKARETIDSKKLKLEHPEIYTQCIKVGKPTRRFAIKEAK
ncbi:lambda-exonuclease family protein [Exiguobacterium sp. s63]|uniref:YqaJ viral recombinase family nuclease n=1 Tax=Exiguobacterium sp. s63 TaxID=2751274 RepID=UPI001BE85E14|nr:YqaJ viral recombinase family protein [Exiguobacterium sp. s63]